MSDRLMTMDEWVGQGIPTPRSFAETAELAFRAVDLEDKRARKRSEEAAATRVANARDVAEVHAFLGHAAPTHADVLARVAAAQDQADQWQDYRDQQAERRREQAKAERAADLEEAVAETATRADRLSRNLTAANQGWAAERRRSEGASFREDRYEQYQDGTGIWKLRLRQR